MCGSLDEYGWRCGKFSVMRLETLWLYVSLRNHKRLKKIKIVKVSIVLWWENVTHSLDSKFWVLWRRRKKETTNNVSFFFVLSLDLVICCFSSVLCNNEILINWTNVVDIKVNWKLFMSKSTTKTAVSKY